MLPTLIESWTYLPITRAKINNNSNRKENEAVCRAELEFFRPEFENCKFSISSCLDFFNIMKF